MLDDTIDFARVAGRALPIIEATNQGHSVDIAVLLGMGIMARRARQPAIQIAVAELVCLLIRKGPHATVRIERPVTEERELDRVVTSERIAGEIPIVQLILHGVTSVANPERRVLVERRERHETDVSALRELAPRGQLHVSARGSVTGFAVDRQRREPR